MIFYNEDKFVLAPLKASYKQHDESQEKYVLDKSELQAFEKMNHISELEFEKAEYEDEILDRLEEVENYPDNEFQTVASYVIDNEVEEGSDLAKSKQEKELDNRVTDNTQKISEISVPLGLDATRQVSRMMVSTMSLSPEEILEVKDIYEEWEAEIEVEEFEYYNYEDNLYQVIKGKGHTAQSDWTPDQTPSLFNKVLPEGEIGEWVQPKGAHDAYQLGDKVYFDDKLWVSIYEGEEDNNNVWKPTEHGWEVVE